MFCHSPLRAEVVSIRLFWGWRASTAVADSGKPKQGQSTEDHWAGIIDRETGVADLLIACEAALEYMRFTGDKELVEKLVAAIAKAKRKTI